MTSKNNHNFRQNPIDLIQETKDLLIKQKRYWRKAVWLTLRYKKCEQVNGKEYEQDPLPARIEDLNIETTIAL